MSTPGSYPPPGPGYQAPTPGYQAPPPGYVPPPPGGLSPNVAAVLCYLFGIVGGIVFLVIEPFKRDSFVRFHAFQSIFVNLGVIALAIAWFVVSFLLTLISHGLFAVISLMVSFVIPFVLLILWIVLMVRAGQGQKWVLPVVGPLAEKQASTFSI